MKKITLTFLFLAVVFFAGAQNVQAEETISDSNKKAQIEEIFKQINALRAKLQELTGRTEIKPQRQADGREVKKPLCIKKGYEKPTARCRKILKFENKKPGVEMLKVTERGTDSVMISWKTNKEADGMVWYTKTRTEIEMGDASKVSEDDLSLTHSFTLDDLESGTQYFYRAVSKDVDGKISQSPIKLFKTRGEGEDDNSDE